MMTFKSAADEAACVQYQTLTHVMMNIHSAGSLTLACVPLRGD